MFLLRWLGLIELLWDFEDGRLRLNWLFSLSRVTLESKSYLLVDLIVVVQRPLNEPLVLEL